MVLRINRNITIEDLKKHFGDSLDLVGWELEEIGRNSPFIEDLDLDIVDLVDPNRGKGKTSGEDAMIVLESTQAAIMLGPEEFLTIMANRSSIPREWRGYEEDEEEEFYIRFYGRLLVKHMPGYDIQAVLTIFWYPNLEQFGSDLQSLADPLDGSEKAAVVYKWRLEESQNES